MLQQIADFIDFDLKRFNKIDVLSDFNHKYRDSWLKINNEYIRIEELKKDVGAFWLIGRTKDNKVISIDNIDSIEAVLPKTGLYSTPEELIYLYRLPARQWIKSISLGRNYDIKRLVKLIPIPKATLFNAILVPNPVYEKESIIYNNHVYLHWKKVGKIVNGIIYVTNPLFYEEINELWKQQYQITLEPLPLQPKDENLILDF